MPTQVRFATSIETIEVSSSTQEEARGELAEETQGQEEETSIGESSSSTWYSPEDDYRRFSQEVLAQAQRLRSILSIIPADGSLPEKDAIECIGIEKYLDSDLFNDITKRRQVHRSVVVRAQIDCDEDDLATVSSAGSAWARDRARQLAHIYSTVIQ